MGTKTRTKLYSALLSVMMLVNLVPTPALAEGEPQPTETPVIVQTETPAAEPENNTAVEPTPTPVTEPTVTEEVPVIPVEENTEPASTETPAPEQTPVSEQEETQDEESEETEESETDSEADEDESEESEEALEEEVEESEEETEEEEVSYPAVTLSETVEGVTVTLKAPEGSLPEGVRMTVEPVHDQAVFDAVDETLAEEGKTLANAIAFDITLFDYKGNELQPNKHVTVSFSNTDLSSAESDSDINVYRVSDDASEVTPVTTVAATETNQMFITDHFTIYLASSDKTTDRGNTADPNGDGSYKPNEQYHRYYLEYGESITLESDESSIFTDEWYIHGTTYNGAITQTGDRTFKNTNLLESYEIATIAHKYGFLGNNVEYFFVSLRPQTKYRVKLYFCGAGQSQFTEFYNEEIKKNFPANPQKKDQYYQEGGTTYIFSGWCSDQECTKPISVRDLNRVERDITAYGKYTESENFAVVFNGNADDCTYIPTTLYGSTNPVTGQPFKYAERPAYTCKGWATSLERASNGIVDYLYPYEGGFVIPQGQQVLELYAVWEETDVTLSYAPNNYDWGKVSRSYEYVKAFGNAQGATATAKDGYRFVKWTDNKGNVLSTEPTFVPQKTDEGYYVYVRHTAVFEPISYTVTFNTNGGSTIEPQTVVKGEKAERPSTNPTKGEGTCFEFNNWYADANLSTVFDFNQPITADTTVYAGWKSGSHNFDGEHMEAPEDPTCTEDGHKGGYECSNCHKHFTDKTGKTEITDWIIPALGHDWETTYSWGDNNTSITATRVCRRDSTHSGDTATGIISTYHRDASCTEKERIIYVATFANENFQTQVKVIDISPALGHEWGTPTYTWDEDNSRVIAVVKCARNSGHVEAESVNTAITTRSATCTSAGSTTYSATFQNPLFTTQTKTVDTPALGHDWDNPTYTWSDNNTTVTAKRICKRDRSHSEEETVSTTHYDSPATCTMPSATVYVAAFKNPEFGVQTKRIEGEIPATGHNWQTPTYEWDDDNSRAFATRHCANDEKHVDVKVVETTREIKTDPTCTVDGEATYTADFSLYNTQDDSPYEIKTKNVTIPALGHSWESLSSTDIRWNYDHTVAYAAFKCERDSTHTTTEQTSTNVESYHQAATCTSHEFTTYTVFFPEGFPVYRETIVSSDEPSHQWEQTPSSYVWSEDYSLAVAIRHCENDRSHVETLVVESTEKITTPPTCETPGKADYSANFGKEGYVIPDAKNIDIPALGHDWGEWEVVKDPTAVEEGLKQRVCAHDRSHVETEALPKVTYSVKTGDGQTWTKGSDVTADFEFERSEENEAKKLTAYDLFTEVQIDGTKISAFKKEKGSVITKIYASYLETLSAGDHKITAKFSDGGSVTASFTVKDKEPAPTPDGKKSSGGSSTPAAPVDNVVTCQMAGYPANYSWNEAAKACQPGYIDAAGNFHPYSTRERAVPNTYDQGLAVHTWILGISALTAVFCALSLRRDSLY